MSEVSPSEERAWTIPFWRSLPLPVLSSPLRGTLWLPMSGDKTLRLFWGSYERAESRTIADHLSPGDVFYDVGASLGYYTLLAARRVDRAGTPVRVVPPAARAN